MRATPTCGELAAGHLHDHQRVSRHAETETDGAVPFAVCVLGGDDVPSHIDVSDGAVLAGAKRAVSRLEAGASSRNV